MEIIHTDRPRGPKDKASDFGSEDCAFESRRGRTVYILFSSVRD